MFCEDEEKIGVTFPDLPFPRVKLADLYDALEKEYGYVVNDEEKGDLTTEAEKLSYDWVKKIIIMNFYL